MNQLLITLSDIAATYWWVIDLLLVATGLIIYVGASHSLHQRRHPAAAISWVLGIVLLPYITLPLYLAFGSRKIVAAKHAAGRHRVAASTGQTHATAARVQQLGMAMGVPDPVAYEDLTVHEDGTQALNALRATIDGAKETIEVSTFLVGRDVLGDEIADMVFTDPPYNVNYANSAKDKMRGKDRAILNDNLGDGFYDFLLAAMTPAVAHCQGGIYVAMSSSELDRLQAAFRAAGGHWSTFVIWAKNTFTLGRADYQRQYEPILYGWPEGADRHWCGDRDQGDVWQIKKPQKNDLHPTMKPVELVERAIRNSSRPGDVVLDPFGGSGTTMIAAHKSGRKARLIELDPKYVDVIVRRWQDYAGAQAVRQADGVAFDALSVGGKLRQEVAAGDVGHVADVAELAGVVGEVDTAD